MDVNPGVVVERAGPRSSIAAAPRHLAGPWRGFRFTVLAWLIISVIVLRSTLASVATVGALLGLAFMPGASGQLLTAAAKSSLPVRRRLAGYALAAVLAPLLTLVLATLRGQLSLQSVTLLERGQHASGATGGRAASWTPVAISGQPPPARPGDVTLQVPAPGGSCLALAGRARPATSRSSLGGLAALATAVLNQQRLAAKAEAAAPIAEADRMRAAVLAAVSHDLCTLLTAAKAAIRGLRARDIQLTAALLATADESLDLLTHFAASLLDMSWLQAGSLPVFPRPADLKEIIARSLAISGRRSRRS